MLSCLWITLHIWEVSIVFAGASGSESIMILSDYCLHFNPKEEYLGSRPKHDEGALLTLLSILIIKGLSISKI